jgi:hypothetical protein
VIKKNKKIKKIYQELESKELLTVTHLERLGVIGQARYHYANNGWLEKIGNGAYKMPGKVVSWQKAVIALQEQLDLSVHVGAKTVFQMAGKAHYLNQPRVYLFFPRNTRLPKWFQSSKFQDTDIKTYEGSVIPDGNLGVERVDGMLCSSHERAILEQISLIGKTEGFEETFKLLEGLTALRSKLLQKLLENCTSVKTKRIFLYCAETINYPWFVKLEPKKIDLGSGPRQIDKKGVYVSKYQIVVPILEDRSHEQERTV